MPSLTWTEAVERARLLTVDRYDVTLALDEGETYRCRTVVTFDCAEPGATSFVELADPLTLEATLNGTPVAHADGRIALPDLAASSELVVEASMPTVTNGDGMHRFVDTDGRTYVSAYTGMDIASRVFPCFDQPDLKARIALAVTAPDGWTVLAHGTPTREAGAWCFPTTPPISTYLFVVCAGPWHSRTWEHAGLPFGWHARAAKAADLDRDLPELRRMTEAFFDHYTTFFTPPYPFASYHQVLVPGHNWGALETPGAVTFRDELLPRAAPTALEQQGLADTIAHEMAHMWFGDLVTMRWWQDSWLNESFADFMGYEVAGRAGGFTDAWSECALLRKPTGYRADERRSTHPIAEDAAALVDVDTAFSNFDMITYAKGNAVLRQLGTWLGRETFLAGTNAYLSAHAFGNADLADFLAAMDSVSDRDVRGWAQRWLRTTGFDTIRVTREGDVPVLTRFGSRPHRFTVAGLGPGGDLVATRLVDLDDDPVRLPEFAGLAVLPNAGDETFARVRLDEASRSGIASSLSGIADPLTRAVAWHTAADMVGTGDLTVSAAFDLLERHLGPERNEVILEGVLRTFGRLRGSLVCDPADLPRAQSVLAATAARLADGVPGAARAAREVLAANTADVAALRALLADGSTEPSLRWTAVGRLVALGEDPGLVEDEARRDGSDAGRLAAITARAMIPTPAAKTAAWSLLVDGTPSNREWSAGSAGFWTPGQDELTGDYIGRYLERAPGIAAERGQGFARLVGASGPVLPLPTGRLRGLRDGLAAALAGDLPPVLRRQWDDLLDDTDRALAVRAG
ncbi:aminopeptidase N [Agilicoccus flavus]|uniref:aminopeptidase N n=1 Tax=Agilicoccus flavus TaxID=2775968 RepID=UPI001CF62F91|nr:aminopeptidase N [Agilicoccus flavus]